MTENEILLSTEEQRKVFKKRPEQQEIKRDANFREKDYPWLMEQGMRGSRVWMELIHLRSRDKTNMSAAFWAKRVCTYDMKLNNKPGDHSM